MLQENLIKMFEVSFREHHNLPALTDYFGKDSLSYFEMSEKIARLHLLFEEYGIQKGDRIALIGRNNVNWCVTYIAVVTYGAVIVPILQDFNPADVENIITHSESRLLFAGDIYWQTFDSDRMPELEAAVIVNNFSLAYEKEGDKFAQLLSTWDADFAAKYPAGFSVEDINYPEVPNEQMILLNYTSGTTGSSKGVMLSVNNLTGNMVFARDMKKPNSDDYYF